MTIETYADGASGDEVFVPEGSCVSDFLDEPDGMMGAEFCLERVDDQYSMVVRHRKH